MLCLGFMISLDAKMSAAPSKPVPVAHSKSESFGPVIGGYRIAVKTNKKVYSLDEKINLIILVKNMAATKTNISTGQPFSSFHFAVLTPGGENASLTTEGEQESTNLMGGSEFVAIMKPGFEQHEELILNDFYDMTVPGKYTIKVSRSFHKRDHSEQYVTVTSNPIVVFVSSVKPRPLNAVVPQQKNSMPPMP